MHIIENIGVHIFQHTIQHLNISPGRIYTANHGTHAASHNKIKRNMMLSEYLYNPNMRQSAGAARTQHQGYPGPEFIIQHFVPPR